MKITPAAIAIWVACACSAPSAFGQTSPAVELPQPVAVPESLETRQKDIGDVLARLTGKRVEPEYVHSPATGLSFTLLPSLGYNPSYGAFIGVSVSVGGWLGDPSSTLASAGSAGFSYSTTEQVSVQLRSDFYLPGNAWVLKGDWRYLDTSQPTYGLGPIEAGVGKYPMEFVLYRLHQSVLRRVEGTDIYVGLGYHFDRHEKITDSRADAGEPTPFSEYSGGTPSRTQVSGISADILADTRDNPINATRGLFWNASIRSFQKPLGSDQDWQGLWSDFRWYRRMPPDRGDVLAIWSYLWFTFGEAPYLMLPAIGWDTYGRSGRGYLQGRTRGVHQVYTEGEYRKRFTADGMWGGVVFVNVTGTTVPQGGAFGTLDPGGGAGLRVKFNKVTDTNLSVDFAAGRNGSSGWFFGLQEVF